MKMIPAYLEILIYQTNNTIKKSIQKDTNKIKLILENIQPQKLFAQNHLTIQGDSSYSVYPTKSVCRVDLIMENYPDWISMNSSLDIIQITEKEFQQKYNSWNITSSNKPSDEIHHGFTEIELFSGEKLYMEVFGKAKTKIERLQLIQQLLSISTLFYKRREGGIIFINPLHIVNITFYPGLREISLNVWPAQII